jgi:hypothetical protein
MFLFKNKYVKAALYVPNCTYEIKDESYYNFNLYYTSNQNTQFCSIDAYKYLIWKRRVNQDKTALVFFIIHDFKEISPNSWKLFLHKYQQIDEEAKINKFLQLFELKGIHKQSTLDLHKLESRNQIFSTDFHPYITAIPTKTKIIDINQYNQEEIVSKISSKLRYIFDQCNELKFKNKHSIILNNNSVTDDEQNFIIKKGIEYSVEFLNRENIWINLKYANFSRTIRPIIYLNIQEPIDHNQHKLINIKTGRPIHKKIRHISDIKEADFVFDTFDSQEAFEKRCDNIRFSQAKFWFEQTNIEQTVGLIKYLKTFVIPQSKVADFEEINNIKYKYKIIHRRNKYLFANGELHHTPGKGLYHSGVYKIPEKLKIKLLVSAQIIETEPLSKIISNINERIEFLYKNEVYSISKSNVIVYDYNNFNEVLVKDSLQEESCSYIVHLIKSNDEQIEDINKNIKEILKTYHQNYEIINSFEKNTLANSILKLGLYNKAIPWKIDCIDSNDKNHVFIGIDLGHDHQKGSTNLTLTAIDNHGCLLIKPYQRKNLALNEAIPYTELIKGFQNVLSKSLNQNVCITIHRDGIYQENIDDYHQVMRELRITKYNLVEVTKTGAPLIGFYSISQGQNIYLDGFSGYYIYIKDPSLSNKSNEISYLITNDQSLKTKTAPSPLKIKKVYGYKTITEITEEIYWLTKAYSVNIFESPKLPITTHLANNLSYTKNLIHFTTE